MVYGRQQDIRPLYGESLVMLANKPPGVFANEDFKMLPHGGVS